MYINKNILHEGDYVTLDGNSGSVYGGKVSLITERPSEIIAEIERWKKSIGTPKTLIIPFPGNNSAIAVGYFQ